MLSHLKTASKCNWYRKGKRMELGATGRAAQEMLEAERAHTSILVLDDDPPVAGTSAGTFSEVPESHSGPSNSDPSGSSSMDVDNASADEDGDDEDNDPEVVEQAFHDELFQFVPPEPLPDLMDVDENGAGPSSSTQRNRRPGFQLDDEDDDRVTDEYPGAAKVIRMDQTLHNKWKRKFSGDVDATEGDSVAGLEPGDNPFAPFASEMDWRVASWAVKDGIGHKSFDRLLAIPGVSIIPPL